jgi:hypothetical protein
MEKRRVNLFELFPTTSFQIDRMFSPSPPLCKKGCGTIKVKVMYLRSSFLSSEFLKT